MDERILQLRVGVVVISAIVITGILIMIFGEWHPATYSVKMRFPSVPGVSENTPIRKNGITIGRVSKVEPTEQGVLIEANIDEKYKIYQSEAAEVGSASMINDDAVIDVIPGPGPFIQAEIVDGDWIDKTTVKKGINDLIEEALAMRSVIEGKLDQAADSIEEASKSFSRASNEIGDVAVTINNVLTDEDGDIKKLFDRAQELSDEAEIALQSFSDVMINVNEIVGDEELRKRLQESLDQIPEILSNADGLLSDARSAITQFEEVGGTVEQNLKNLEGLTQPLGENGEAILSQFQMTISDVDAMVNQITKFLHTLNNSEGTVGKLLNDPELHDSLLRSMKNVEELTRRVKPIIADVRTISNKLAIDPRQIGVKGALDRRPVGSGPKGTLLFKDPK